MPIQMIRQRDPYCPVCTKKKEEPVIFSRQTCAVLLASAAWVSTATAQAGISVSDDFSLSASASDPRYAGKQLNGTTTVAGGATWVANSSTLFSGSGATGYVRTVTGSMVAKIATIVNASTPLLTLEVDARHASSGFGANGTNGGWIAMGFGELTSDNIFKNGVFVLINSLGAAEINVNNNGTVTKLASLSGLTSDSNHRLKLTYDSTAKQVTAWIDSTRIGNTSYNLGAFTPTVNYAGFSTYNTLAGGTIDNFSLTTVPEPATLGALGLGTLLLARRAR